MSPTDVAPAVAAAPVEPVIDMTVGVPQAAAAPTAPTKIPKHFYETEKMLNTQLDGLIGRRCANNIIAFPSSIPDLWKNSARRTTSLELDVAWTTLEAMCDRANTDYIATHVTEWFADMNFILDTIDVSVSRREEHIAYMQLKTLVERVGGDTKKRELAKLLHLLCTVPQNGYKCELDGHKLHIITDRIVLRYGGHVVDFGPMKVILPLNEYVDLLSQGNGTAKCFKVEPLEPNCAGGERNGEFHPHYRSHMCTGAGEDMLNAALSEGNLEVFCDVVVSILNTYNNQSPYRHLESWVGTEKCVDCTMVIPRTQSDIYHCPDCNHPLCNNTACGTTIGGARFCANCFKSCKCCSKPARIRVSLRLTPNTRGTNGDFACSSCTADCQSCGVRKLTSTLIEGRCKGCADRIKAQEEKEAAILAAAMEREARQRASGDGHTVGMTEDFTVGWSQAVAPSPASSPIATQPFNDIDDFTAGDPPPVANEDDNADDDDDDEVDGNVAPGTPQRGGGFAEDQGDAHSASVVESPPARPSRPRRTPPSGGGFAEGDAMLVTAIPPGAPDEYVPDTLRAASSPGEPDEDFTR